MFLFRKAGREGTAIIHKTVADDLPFVIRKAARFSTVIIFISIVISRISPIVLMLFGFGFRFASVLPRILPLRGYYRWSPLRYERQDHFRLHFRRLLARARSHSCPGRGSNPGADGRSLAASRDGADQGTECSTATDLGYI